MEVEQLKQILERHAAWLDGKPDGVRADLRGANLLEADLRESDLSEADLRWADLREADLRRANLRRANLWGADLRWANLSMACLSEADLRWANLYEANLREASVVQLSFDCWTMTVTATDIFVGCERVPNDDKAEAAFAALAEKYKAADALPQYLAALEFARRIIG